ncbi:uncharacterized protein BXZ73DRAFT_87164 [Epithele typhae]|uniref:uncharacterized protein n=1 Tax=Epithele typhae TaxID=378194 RepID=UPI002008CB47|nr:uncharacterized protein BXZ73DRAFT_87164 [Epithele typhae]KAH9944221.1 hypothetical protein BXZ73DRAFT_87164 [Epithele typhae]
MPPARMHTPMPPPQEEGSELSALINGPPTESFRDNLRPDKKYITSWAAAGWTNDVMTYANLIYLGSITDRIPIMPMFTPSHIGGHVPPIPFGEVFDVPRFVKESGIEILEWDEVKDPNSGLSTTWAVQNREHFPRRSAVPGHLGLDISYTTAPEWIKLIPESEHDKGSTFWSLARLSFPEERARNIGKAVPSPLHNTTVDPDDHLLCFDYLYYVCAQQSSEWELDYAPMWRNVLRHLHWTERIETITQVYLRNIFALPDDTTIPPFIAVHARRGDFATNLCWEAKDPADCLPPLSVIQRRVMEVQEELRERKGLDIPASRVIITGDEKDPAWWDQARALGWKTVDHETAGTAPVLGEWYPLLIDAAIQSTAVGFVGTQHSTYSIVSRRRVESWNDGSTRTVRIGYLGADDH